MVLFVVILTILQNNVPLNLGTALLKFIVVTGGGVLIGGLCGYLIYRIIKLTEDHLLQVTLTVVLVFGTPLIAEFLHCSGIIAVVVAGLMIGKGRLSCMSTKGHQTTETFWEVIDFILNSLIFIIIGIELQVVGMDDLIAYKELILTGVLIVLLSRAFIVYCTMFVYNKIIKPSLPKKWNHILFWGGLRGTIPIILMLELPDFQYRPLFLSATFSIVLFSIIIQGLTIEPLLKKLDLQQKK